MKSSIHKMVEQIMLQLGPIFHENPDYEDIRVAMSLVMARVIQAAPHPGLELSILAQTQTDISDALTQLLKLEEEAINAKAAERDRALSGVEAFSGLAINGHAAEAQPIVDAHLEPKWVGEHATLDEDEQIEEVRTLAPEEVEDVLSAIRDEASKETKDWLERDAETREPEKEA